MSENLTEDRTTERIQNVEDLFVPNPPQSPLPTLAAWDEARLMCDVSGCVKGPFKNTRSLAQHKRQTHGAKRKRQSQAVAPSKPPTVDIKALATVVFGQAQVLANIDTMERFIALHAEATRLASDARKG